MPTNEIRRELLNRVKASGYPGSITEVFQAADQGIDLVEQHQLQQQQQQEQMQVANTPQQQEIGLREQHAMGNTDASMVFPDVQPGQSFNTVGMQAPIDIQKVDDLKLQIDDIYEDIAGLNDEAFEARQIVRDLELEVGPIKYVAQLLYGEANAEQYFGQAVRILILTIIFVFDPLAVLLLIATAKSWIIIVKNREPEVKIVEKEKVVYKEAVKGGHTQEEHWENLRKEEEQWLDENAPPEPLTEKSQKWFKDLYNKFKTVSIDKKNIEDAEKNPPV